MKLSALILAMLLCLSGCSVHECREITARDFHVLRVVDGDTLEIEYDGEPTKVRLYGMNAPEPHEPGGVDAKMAMQRMADGQRVRLDFAAERKRDNFGRLLANVYVDGQDVGQAMIETGHAVPYRTR